VIASWLDAHAAMFTYTPPDAGAIVYARYQNAINSTELVTRLRLEKSVLIVPGDHFGMDHYLRLGFGDRLDHLRDGLTHLHDLLCSI
jgi:aspartate/methionine/tyrosine aminotransferase